MKRKSNQPIPIKTFKRKDTMSCYSATSDKDHSIYDYFKLMQPKDGKKSHCKPLTYIQDTSKRKLFSKKFLFVKNPSKLQPSTTVTQCIYPEAKYSNIFTEDKIESLIPSFERVIAEFKSEFTSGHFSPYSFTEREFSSFVNANLQSILIKYLLHIDDDLLFIPKRFLQSINENTPLSKKDKEMAKLLSGLDDSKKIMLKYSPINIKETQQTSKGLCEILVNYLNNFNIESRESKKALQKALVIYNTEDYLQYTQLIDTICTDHGYETIKINDLSLQKVTKLKMISEATRSQRLSSLSEDLVYKMNIIEAIVSYHKAKWQNLSQVIDENSLAMSETTIDSTENHSTQSTNDPTFLKFQQSVHQIFMNKKSVLFLVDSFSEGDSDKAYIANIISTIPETKSPIILLTNNLCLLTSNQNTMKHFVFYHWTNKDNIKQKEHYIIYLGSFVLFLHLYLSNAKESLTKEEKSKTFYDDYLIKELSHILKDDVFRIKMINDKICNRIISLAIYISLKYNFRFEEIFIEYSRLIRSVSSILTKDKNEALKMIEREVYCDNDSQCRGNSVNINNIDSNDIYHNESINEEESMQEEEDYYSKDDEYNGDIDDEDRNEIKPNTSNTYNELMTICNEKNEISFEDCQLGKINQISNRTYSYKTTFRSYEKDDVNIEDIYLRQIIRHNFVTENNTSLTLFNALNDKTFKKRALEDRRFLSNSIISSYPFVSFKSLPVYYSLIKCLNSISVKLSSSSSSSSLIWRLIEKQFNYSSNNNNKKKPKSVQKKEKSILGKLFKKTNEEQFKRYFQVHDYNYLITHFKQSYFANYNKENIGCYYRYNRIIDNLKPKSLISSMKSNNTIDYDLLKNSSYSKERRLSQQ